MGFDLAQVLESTQADQLPNVVFTPRELMKLVTDRKLTGSLHRVTKAGLVFALEDADANPIFHKFTKLAPELRLCVHEHHFRQLNKKGPISTSQQPAITRASRLIRKEAVPLFYTTAVFGLHWHGETPFVQPPQLRRPNIELEAHSTATFARIAQERFNAITNFDFTICTMKATSNPYQGPVLDLLISITFNSDGGELKIWVTNRVRKQTIVNQGQNDEADPDAVRKWFGELLTPVMSRPRERRWRASDFAEVSNHFSTVAKDIGPR